ncbi:MAG: RdgB/HAM1 family non-canonical purine NTP pyrophosphatase [Cyclobacteriaceae bacterium]
MKLCCATNNANKLQEITALIGDMYEIVNLKEIGCAEDIPEDFETIEENSAQKAWYVFDNYQIDCFADDSGLEVDALNGAPGVHSAFYAGLQKSYADNVQKLLKELDKVDNRAAQFKTVITLVQGGEQMQFEGIVRGEIIETPRGAGGFGYDPVFIPDGANQTFAEMDANTKNHISHRGIAIRKLIAYLKQNK